VDGECPLPELPLEAERAFRTWRRLDALRDFGGGAVIMAQAGLSTDEIDLLVTIEDAVQEVRRANAPGREE